MICFFCVMEPSCSRYPACPTAAALHQAAECIRYATGSDGMNMTPRISRCALMHQSEPCS